MTNDYICIMDTRQAYNLWAEQYDSNTNLTRDLEAVVLRSTLEHIPFKRCLEIGCGTGKNTVWLLNKAEHITAVDLSEEMLSLARTKVASDAVDFVRADITEEWNFTTGAYDLVTFSLVLEHIEFLEPVFEQVAYILQPGGYVYVGELHPFKQYSGSKARFETSEGTQVVSCYDHHISDFIHAARKFGLEIISLDEHFDEGRNGLPRILSLLFKKSYHA